MAHCGSLHDSWLETDCVNQSSIYTEPSLRIRSCVSDVQNKMLSHLEIGLLKNCSGNIANHPVLNCSSTHLCSNVNENNMLSTLSLKANQTRIAFSGLGIFSTVNSTYHGNDVHDNLDTIDSVVGSQVIDTLCCCKDGDEVVDGTVLSCKKDSGSTFLPYRRLSFSNSQIDFAVHKELSDVVNESLYSENALECLKLEINALQGKKSGRHSYQCIYHNDTEIKDLPSCEQLDCICSCTSTFSDSIVDCTLHDGITCFCDTKGLHPLTTCCYCLKNVRKNREDGDQPLVPCRRNDLADEATFCHYDVASLIGKKNVDLDTASECPPISRCGSFGNHYVSNCSVIENRHHDGKQFDASCPDSTDSDDSEVYRLVPNIDGNEVLSVASLSSVQPETEDSGDFIDEDLPVVSAHLQSTSTDAASASSTNSNDIVGMEKQIPETAEETLCLLENYLSVRLDRVFNSSHIPFCCSSSCQAKESSGNRYKCLEKDNNVPFDQGIAVGNLCKSSESENKGSHAGGGGLPISAGFNSFFFTMTDVAQPTSQTTLFSSPSTPTSDFPAVDNFGRICYLQDQPSSTSHSCPSLTSQAGCKNLIQCHRIGVQYDGLNIGTCHSSVITNNFSQSRATCTLAHAHHLMNIGHAGNGVRSNYMEDGNNLHHKVFDESCINNNESMMLISSTMCSVRCKINASTCSVTSTPGAVCCIGGVFQLDDIDLEYNVEELCGRPTMFNVVPANHHPVVESGSNLLASDCVGVCQKLSSPILPSDHCSKTRHCRIATGQVSEGSPKSNACNPNAFIERVMIWSEREAYNLLVKQIGLSACGQTAVLNVLRAFGMECEKEEVCRIIKLSARKEKAPVAEYLLSRAAAGMTADHMLSGLVTLTGGRLCGRFFHTWPQPDVNILCWLSTWIDKGAVPVVTLNLQQGVKGDRLIPDSWHHQMVYGVGPEGVYLTNPQELVSGEILTKQLTSDSTLLVRRDDIVSRFQQSASFDALLWQPDSRWCSMNVLGQVVNVLRESDNGSSAGHRSQLTTHVRIPAAYRAGVTLYAQHDSSTWAQLRVTGELSPSVQPTTTSGRRR